MSTCKPGEIIQLTCTGDSICESVQRSVSNTIELTMHNTRIANNATDISGLNSDIVQNTSDIFDNRINIAYNKQEIENINNSGLTARVTQNEDDIVTLFNDVSVNATNIATNASDINTNKSNITSNFNSINSNKAELNQHSTSINTNISNISINSGKIDQNSSDINTNASGISQNALNISTNSNDIQSLQNDFNSLPTLYASLNGSSSQVFSVADPAATEHAINLGFADARYINSSGYYTKTESDARFVNVTGVAYDSDRLGGSEASNYVLQTHIASKSAHGIARQATDSEAVAGLVDDCYMSPKQVADAIAAAPQGSMI